MAPMILIMAAVFALCYLADKGFTKLFRGKVQHQSGKSVRLSRRYASVGLIVGAIGVSAAFMGMNQKLLALLIGGCVLVLMGIALVIYYMSFGIYYDEDSFILSSFGKSSKTYLFGQIRSQQLYLASGNVVVELHMNDGNAFQVHAAMNGTEDFLNHAFTAWLRQTGRKQEDCPWYDPDNSCWFPKAED